MRANIYIKKENEEAWEASTKSEFVNEYLQAQSFRPRYATPFKVEPGNIRVKEDYVVGMMPDSNIIPMTPTKVIGIDEAKLREAQARKDLDFCKHGSVNGFCKKGCR